MDTTVNPNPTNQKINQKGYTLVELAIAVAILAVLIVAGLTGVQGILTSGKVNDQIKTVAKLGSRISANYASLSTSGVTLSTITNLSGWDPSKVSVSGSVTSVKSSFGSNEFITTNNTATGGMGANAGFIYTIAGVPNTACVDLANGLGALVYGIAVQAAAATPAAVTTFPTSSTGTTAIIKTAGGTSIDPATAGTACALNTTSDFVIALKP